jgi:hypothetical protein
MDAWRLEHSAAGLRQATQAHQRQEASLLAGAGGVEAVRSRLDAIRAWNRISALDKTPIPAFLAAFAAAGSTGQILPRRLDWSATSPDGAPRLLLEGEISPFDGHFQAAHQRVESLRSQLQIRLPAGAQASVSLWPLDTASDRGVEGEFGHSRLNARFRIEVKGQP